MTEEKRVFVGGLSSEITANDLSERFKKFCEVLNVEIKKKRINDNEDKTFAYVNVKAAPENLQKCISVYDKTKWKGSELRLQIAKENFLSRLETERKNGFQTDEKKKLKTKKEVVEHHNPYQNLPDPSVPELKGCVPGTQVPGERNWVVGKYGRVLPVVYIRNKDKKKVIKIDPSKFCHNVKKVKEDDIISDGQNITLEIAEKDSELSRKRQGEFPEWISKPSKNKKYDFDALREKYLNNKNEGKYKIYPKEPDFEIVSKDINMSHVGTTYESDDIDSDSYYSSIKQCNSQLSNSAKITQKCNDMSDSDSDSCLRNNTKSNIHNNEACNTVEKSKVKNIENFSTKPKMKPFGGTKELYKNDTEVSPEKSEIQNETPKKKKVKNTPKIKKISNDLNSKNRTIIEDDGNDSVSSAGTDEIISRLKCQLPDFSKTHIRKGSSLPYKKDSILNTSLLNEYSSGLVGGDIPVNNSSGSSCESDDSDFEVYAKRQMSKIKSKQTNIAKGVENEMSAIGAKQSVEKESEKVQNKITEKVDSGNKINDTSNKEMVTNVTKTKAKESINKNISFDTIESDASSLSCTTDSSSDISSESDMRSESGTSSDSDNDAGDTKIKQNVKVGKKRENCNKKEIDATKTQSNKIKCVENDIPQAKNVMDTKKDSNKVRSETRIQDLDANQKRLESLKQRQKENKAQKNAIQEALANIDSGTKSNKKIVFDSDSDDDDITQPKQTEDNSSSDSSTEDEDNSRDERNELKLSRKPMLFDSSEDEENTTDEDEDKEMFKIRPEFEGRSGQKRMELQSRYGNDDRFKLDERFIESDEDEKEDEDHVEKPEDDEKTKSLKILEEVVGTKLRTEKKGKVFKDVSALHFDPTREDHSQYEVQQAEKPKREKKTPKKKSTKETEEKIEELPEVSKEKFFDVSESLTDAFKPNKATTQEPQGFSLLAAFGSKDSQQDPDNKSDQDEMTEKPLQHKPNVFPWQQVNANDSSESEDNMDVDLESDEDNAKSKTVVFSSEKEFFFFQENDERITEGIKNFCRQESLDEIREKWLEKRPSLVEAYRNKHKNRLRNMKSEEKQKRTKKFIRK